jgi:hypothetical protein
MFAGIGHDVTTIFIPALLVVLAVIGVVAVLGTLIDKSAEN